MTYQHGASAYRNQQIACRCEICRNANTAYCKVEQAHRAARLRDDPSLTEHGSLSTYRNWGCRCRPCIDANARKSASYRETTKKGK